MNINLYYCNINNFGDRLNEYIFSKCFGINAQYSDVWNAEYVGIGSILDNFLLQTKDFSKFYQANIKNLNKPVKILSSGFGREIEYYKKKFRFFFNPVFKRKLEVISLRGKLSLQQLNLIDKDIDTSNIVLGDLGLLSSYLLQEKNIDKKYNLGICPHYADKNDKIFYEILKNNENSIILDTEKPPLEFLKNLSQCKAIISTGLHPLIVADSLGIPNLWCRISEKTTTRFKYYDYYSNFSIQPRTYNLYQEEILYEKVLSEYKIKNAEIEEIKQKLYNHHAKYFQEFL